MQNQLDNHNHDPRYFRRDEHVDQSIGLDSRAKPIVLNAEGKVDASMLDVATFYYQGTWLPTLAVEYPPIDGATPNGALWLIEGLGVGIPYTFTTGDLAGRDVIDGSMIIWNGTTWSAVHGDPQSRVYYALDGTRAITDTFAGGGQIIHDIADGVALIDGATVGQVDSKIDASLNIGNYSTRR